MKNPPADLAQRLLDISEQVLQADPPPRLEDVAGLVGASRATLYYYFAGRDDLLAFLLTAHVQGGAQAVRAAVDATAAPEARLAATVAALAGYLGKHPGICAGLLGALGATGRMTEVLQANDVWIAGPLRVLLSEARAPGRTTIGEPADAANAMLGALLLAVLGRALSGADPTDGQFCQQLTAQVLHGVLTR